MRVTLHGGAGPFLAKAEGLLASDPFSTNVMAVVAGRVVAGDQADSRDYLWVTIEDEEAEGRVVGMAMHTPPHNLFLSVMPAEAAAALAGALFDGGRELGGVNGAVGSTGAFAQVWEARAGRPSRVVTAMRMYRLVELVCPEGVPGQAALARAPADLDRVAGWFAAFHDEAQPHAPSADWRAFAEGRVAAGQVHFWVAGAAPVAMAALSAPAAGVARVGPVYTPPPSRRQGYGAAVTAAATAAALDAGAAHVVLYTDLANATSNAIYQAIGFRAHHDAEERSLG